MSWIERDRDSVAAIGKLRFADVAFTAGDGRHLITEDGRRVLDLTSGAATASLGYGHPALVKAVSDAVRTAPGAGNITIPNPYAITLAEHLLERVPGIGQRKVWLGHAASDATETAIKTLQGATGRPRVITFIGGYHGGTTGAMLVSAKSPHAHTLTGSGHMIVPYPDDYRPLIPGGAEAVLGYIDGLFETICPPEQVAAIIYEPLLSDGGMMPMPDAFLVGLSERCRRHGIALVADEAKVGLGRTGTMLASEHAGVSPDVVILGKGLGGGLPLSAVIGPAELMDFTERFALQSTHGNPVCAAAGLAVLRTIEDEHLLDNSRVLGERLAAGFRLLASHHEIIGDVRGRGLAIGIELVRDRDTRAPDAGLCARTIEHALEYGALLFSVGMHHNVLQVVPALTLTVAEADHAIEIMDRALSAAVALH